MADSERVVMDERRACAMLDSHHGRLLGCPSSDLRRTGWTVVSATPDADPMALLFGRRTLLRLVVPVPEGEAGADEAHVQKASAGAVAVAPELRRPVAAFLDALPPEVLFTQAGLAALDALLRGLVSTEMTPLEQAHQHVSYCYAGSFRSYLGPWLDWIEPLDEATEVDPAALSLLARYARGVYVIRQTGAIVAWAGIRAPSPHIWEIDARIELEMLRGRGLGRAVAARATRAALAAGRLPISVHPARQKAAQVLNRALGFHLYANTLHYLSAR